MLEPARRLISCLALMALVMISLPARAQVSAAPRYAAIVVDAASGEVLYAKSADSPRYPASITKVMTLYLTFEALSTGRIQLDDPVMISPRAAAQGPTKLGLPVGASLTVSEAMQALAIKSANDVAVALAEKLGGSERQFAAMMTLRAQDLGMLNTHFVNASGLPDSRQLSSARDIAILSRAVMRDYPQYYGLFSQRSFTFHGKTMNNHNALLVGMAGVDGLKTGFTNASGHNLAVSMVRGDHRIIAVVLGSPSNASRNGKARSLMLTGFDVIRRRHDGETLLATQDLFEAGSAPVLLAQASSPAQGDEDDDDKVILTSAPAPKNLSRFEIVDPATTGLHSPPAAGRGGWGVQVGAFQSKTLAQRQLAEIRDKFAHLLGPAEPKAPERSGGTWRAQFSGLNESQAKDTCSTLKSKRQPCMVVGPG